MRAPFAPLLALTLIVAPHAAARTWQAAAPLLTDAQMEQFLLTARVADARELSKGVTASLRATLSGPTLTHDVHIQDVSVTKAEFRSRDGLERNFRDSWRFNIAAYRIDRLLDLRLVPVSVQRSHKGSRAAFTWWIDDVLMDEGERLTQKVLPPDMPCWIEQARLLHVFDELIDNRDRNVGNTLITTKWRIWAIDHTRAFRYGKVLRNPARLTGIDRGVLARLEALDFAVLERIVDGHISDTDIRNLLARRDAMVEHFRKLGEAALYDRRDPETGCRGTL